MNEYKLFINGQPVNSSSQKKLISRNPYNNEEFATVHQANESDILKAIDAADQAFQTWKDTLPQQKELIFLKAADLMEQKSHALIKLLTQESGSTQLKAGFELHLTPSTLRGMAGECRRVAGQTFVSESHGVRSYSIRKPLGVITAISPFNFPLLLTVRKIGWAIAAGNCVVLKPSEATPIIALQLGEIFKEAGLPDGVLNIVPAQATDIGDILIDDPRVKKVTFTGSTLVGKKIAQKAAAHLKKFTLELGGKNPMIVLKDADIKYAVDAAAFSNFIHQGQVCMTGSRIIVEDEIYEEFCNKFAQKAQSLKAGDPSDPTVIVGPLIRSSQINFIKSIIAEAQTEGARLLTGGDNVGNCLLPTVIADVTENMSIFQRECFGPVASIIRAKDYKDAIRLANNSEYGLSSAVITNDLQKSYEISEALETGMVHINGPTIRDEAVAPFGGVKNSGFGREGGQFSMDEFTEVKWVTVQLGQQDFPF